MSEDKVTVKVVPSEALYDIYQAKIEQIASEAKTDDHYAGMKAGLEFAQVKITQHQVEIPTDVLPEPVEEV